MLSSAAAKVDSERLIEGQKRMWPLGQEIDDFLRFFVANKEVEGDVVSKAGSPSTTKSNNPKRLERAPAGGATLSDQNSSLHPNKLRPRIPDFTQHNNSPLQTQSDRHAPYLLNACHVRRP